MTLPNTNIAGYLNYNYGQSTVQNYDDTKKAHERFQSLLLDLQFLKSCRSKDIIPKFLIFKTANNNLSSSSVYKDCQRRLLNVEINSKYRELNFYKNNYMFFLDELKKTIPENVLQHVSEYIKNRSDAVLFAKEKNLKEKMEAFEIYDDKIYRVDRNIVKNLSSRILTDEEIDCLAHGLDFGLIPKNVDDMDIISNIENFFSRVTDIFENHKKIASELKDNDKFIAADVRVLNTKELSLASSLRSITDSFRSQAHQFEKKQNRITIEQQNYRNILTNLRKDKLITIARPDKGRGIVILNKADYLSKIHTMLNDSSKFQCLTEDPTISRETKLRNLLNRLFNDGHISEAFRNRARSTGSLPGRLYGLPKTHKKDVPLRPVLSAIGTFNYGLAKSLTPILSTIIKKHNTIRDSFSFVKELLALPKSMSKYKMVSFDIASLYTNVPLNETIDIILEHLYDGDITPPVMDRKDMKKLLILATQNSHFLFDGKLYDQIDGVSMGSPLAPLLAEIFLQNFEKKYLSSLETMGIFYWKRFVDDTFVLIDSTSSVKDICNTLSQFHKSIKFTCEEEDRYTNKLPFLDVLVQRKPDEGFHTRIYRKPTFTGHITKWDSFVPKNYKYSALSTMVYRAIKICSSYDLLHRELNSIRSIARRNGYPSSLLNSIIRRQLDLLYTAPKPILPPPLTNDTVVFRVPYFGPLSQIYAKRITSTINKNYPLKQIRVILDVTERIGNSFTLKDPIPENMQSGVVYEATCPDCNMKYIGKTYRHYKTRIHEHLNDQKNDLCLKKIITKPISKKKNKKSILKPIIEQKGPVTRSQTGKSPKIPVKMSEEDIDKLLQQTRIIDKQLIKKKMNLQYLNITLQLDTYFITVTLKLN
ncbi:unnamed protein product [Adineta steineri]|uniref:Reverse transcriptase domain-containing protein n=2 Tax=Adineta steineri TaxID=433720 RepID=A0A815SGS9_9BILA|nr:unnamed protein product [Adineta steineri]